MELTVYFSSNAHLDEKYQSYEEGRGIAQDWNYHFQRLG